MDNRYGGYNRGMNGDIAAANYFDKLPLEMKEEINRRAADIHSFQDLRELAEYHEPDEES